MPGEPGAPQIPMAQRSSPILLSASDLVPMPVAQQLGCPADRPELGRGRLGGVHRALGEGPRSEEHTSELQSRENLVCRLLLEKKKKEIICYNDAEQKDIKYVKIYEKYYDTNVKVQRIFAYYPHRLTPFYTLLLFFFNDTATTEIYTLSLHDALPISDRRHALLLLAITATPPFRRRL